MTSIKRVDFTDSHAALEMLKVLNPRARKMMPQNIIKP